MSFEPARREKMGVKLGSVAAMAASLAALLFVGAATGHAVTGSATIAGAPVIPLNGNVQGDFSYSTISLPACCGGLVGQFYKVNLEAGDHVTVRLLSTGNDAPCADFYKPGTDDYNFDEGNYLQDNVNHNYNTNHGLEQFIAGTSGTWVLMVSNWGYDDCSSDSNQWAYSFYVQAPHGLHLSLASGHLVTGVNHLKVAVRDALNQPVADPTLSIGLATQSPKAQAKQIARVHVRNGMAAFVFTLPRSDEGKRLKIIAGGGDNIHWVETVVSRSYVVG